MSTANVSKNNILTKDSSVESLQSTRIAGKTRNKNAHAKSKSAVFKTIEHQRTFLKDPSAEFLSNSPSGFISETRSTFDQQLLFPPGVGGLTGGNQITYRNKTLTIQELKQMKKTILTKCNQLINSTVYPF